MTVKITEVTQEDRATFGMRLQGAREQKGLTRKQVADATGIPVKSVEKFETGLMSPNVERLKSLTAVLDISTGYLLDGEEAPVEVAATDQPEEFDTATAQAHDLNMILTDLDELDRLREAGFENAWRTAPRLIEEVEGMLTECTYDDLLDIAETRGLKAIPIEEINSFHDKEPEEQDFATGELIDRIIDTAFFGIDLLKLETAKLEKLADKLRLKKDKGGPSGLFERWSCCEAIVKALRPPLREKTLIGEAPNLDIENTKLGTVVA